MEVCRCQGRQCSVEFLFRFLHKNIGGSTTLELFCKPWCGPLLELLCKQEHNVFMENKQKVFQNHIKPVGK